MSVSVQLAVALLYVVVDWFERSEYFWKNSVAGTTIAAYYAAKLPLIVSQTAPLAVGAGVVLTLVIANRAGELLALRSGGSSSMAMLAPVYVAIAGVSFLLLAWGEYVVPPTATRAQQINLSEIKRRERKNVLADAEVWMRGRLGFYHIGVIDRKRQMLADLTIYELDSDFRLHSIAHFPILRWTPHGWWQDPAYSGANWLPAPSDPLGVIPQQLLSRLEPFSEFVEFQREPEELGFWELYAQIVRLKERGLSASHYLPELHAKLAVPFAPLVLVVFLSPLAASTRLRKRTALVVLIAMVAGFMYWFILSLSQAVGGSGEVAAAVSAWLPNLVFFLAGIAFARWLQ